MNNIIYIIGLIVVVLAVLAFFWPPLALWFETKKPFGEEPQSPDKKIASATAGGLIALAVKRSLTNYLFGSKFAEAL